MLPLGDQGSAEEGGPLGLCQTAGCHVFFTQIRNSEQKAYVLKNKELTGPTKGVIFLEADVIFNAVSVRCAWSAGCCLLFLLGFFHTVEYAIIIDA